MERLREAGLDAGVGHDAANLPERGRGRRLDRDRRGQPGAGRGPRARARADPHRGELLAELCAEKRLIAVAGTHGKTTTTAMLVWALRALGADPAFFVGGEVPGLGGRAAAANAGWGEGEWVVAEADESDASFLELKPEIAVITNIEMDHHARWGSVAELRAAFAEFADGRPGSPSSTRTRPGRPSFALAVPGRHNLLNARAALAAVELAGLDVERGGGGARRLPRRAAAARAEGRARRDARSTTTTPTTRPRCAPRSRPCASSARAG